MKNKQREFQAVVLSFDDGTSSTFTGPAVAWPGDKRKIVDVAFTPPEPLADDCHFEKIEVNK